MSQGNIEMKQILEMLQELKESNEKMHNKINEMQKGKAEQDKIIEEQNKMIAELKNKSLNDSEILSNSDVSTNLSENEKSENAEQNNDIKKNEIERVSKLKEDLLNSKDNQNSQVEVAQKSEDVKSENVIEKEDEILDYIDPNAYQKVYELLGGKKIVDGIDLKVMDRDIKSKEFLNSKEFLSKKVGKIFKSDDEKSESAKTKIEKIKSIPNLKEEINKKDIEIDEYSKAIKKCEEEIVKIKAVLENMRGELNAQELDKGELNAQELDKKELEEKLNNLEKEIKSKMQGMETLEEKRDELKTKLDEALTAKMEAQGLTESQVEAVNNTLALKSVKIHGMTEKKEKVPLDLKKEIRKQEALLEKDLDYKVNLKIEFDDSNKKLLDGLKKELQGRYSELRGHSAAKNVNESLESCANILSAISLISPKAAASIFLGKEKINGQEIEFSDKERKTMFVEGLLSENLYNEYVTKDKFCLNVVEKLKNFNNARLFEEYFYEAEKVDDFEKIVAACLVINKDSRLKNLQECGFQLRSSTAEAAIGLGRKIFVELGVGTAVASLLGAGSGLVMSTLAPLLGIAGGPALLVGIGVALLGTILAMVTKTFQDKIVKPMLGNSDQHIQNSKTFGTGEAYYSKFNTDNKKNAPSDKDKDKDER